LIRELQRKDPSVSYISLARNFGHQEAISAGLHFATGEATIVMDGDLQDPPELIPALAAQWRAGYQVVYAQRTSRKSGSPIKKAAAYAFYRIHRRLTNIDIPPDAGDFCLMDRRVVAMLRRLPERSRYLRGLRVWTGFPSVGVPFTREPRLSGKSKYTYRRLFKLASDGVVSFSRAPLRLATYLGFLTGAVAVVAFLAGGFWSASNQLTDRLGYVMLAAAILFIGAVQLICLGILGAYVGQIHEEVKGRPLFTIKESGGVDPDLAGPFAGA
jgi:dolichol-phosphate mannosyltransferase